LDDRTLHGELEKGNEGRTTFFGCIVIRLDERIFLV
jgi:hypothetical protein